jgi:hypothetical protein
MTTRDLITLCSERDTGSFLVPCYGFDTPEAAEAYAGSPEFFAGNRIFGPDDAFAPLYRGRWSYVPRMSAQHGRWLTTELVGRDARFAAGKPSWEMLRGKDTPKRAGAYNVALLVEGRRQFFRCHRHTTKHPKWWYRLADGDRDCFSVWSRCDGGEIRGAMVVDASTRMYAARSARGVIYAREMRFDNSGKPSGFRTTLVRVEFSILDRDPARDDMLRVQVSDQVCFSDNPGKPEEPSLHGLDDVWTGLIDRARGGFERWCQPVPNPVESWRQLFIAQRDKAEADRRTYDGTSFGDRVKGMDWQEALRLVQEPWQLQVVIGAHCNSRFDESPGYYDANYNRVGKMLATHDCSPERRQELLKMVADYVEPCDNLWNYTGD